MAEFKLTLIKGHTKENAYDGYGAHHHWELVNMPAADYMSKVNALGLVFPNKSMKHLIVSPWLHPWIRENVELTSTGYDFYTLADVEYRGRDFYAFGDYHDGIDGEPTDLAPGALFARVRGGYTNGNDRSPTAEIYEVTLDEILENWKSQLGVEALDEFKRLGKVSEPEKWKKTLEEPVQQWLFWQMMSRLMK